MPIPLLDLKAQYANIKDDVLGAVSEVLESQRCIGGPKVEQLEKKIAAYCKCDYAVGVSSGTDAILNSLMSIGIGPGDEVITTPFTFFSTAGCVARLGAKPIFVDIDPKTYNIDPASIEEAITTRTKAIIPVHLFGQMADMDPIMAIAGSSSLAVIEDACQAIGAEYKGKRAGSIGTTGCFSFFPSKNLGGIGDGGMIVCNDEELADKMRIMRTHGQFPQYHYKFVGGNFRLDPIQAAALLVKLQLLDKWSRGRAKNAAYYNKKFKAYSEILTPYISPDCTTVYNQYVIRVPRRDELVEHLKSKKIGCAIYYPIPLHLNECFKDLGYSEGDLPNSEKAAKEVVALPVYPELTNEMQDEVVDAIVKFLELA